MSRLILRSNIFILISCALFIVSTAWAREFAPNKLCKEKQCIGDTVARCLIVDSSKSSAPIGSFTCSLFWQNSSLKYLDYSLIDTTSIILINDQQAQNGGLKITFVDPHGVSDARRIVHLRFLNLNAQIPADLFSIDVTAMAAARTFENLLYDSDSCLFLSE